MRRAIDSVTNKVLPEVSEHLVVANQADAIGDLRATMRRHRSERQHIAQVTACTRPYEYDLARPRTADLAESGNSRDRCEP